MGLRVESKTYSSKKVFGKTEREERKLIADSIKEEAVNSSCSDQIILKDIFCYTIEEVEENKVRGRFKVINKPSFLNLFKKEEFL
jgi:hypothetical protein